MAVKIAGISAAVIVIERRNVSILFVQPSILKTLDEWYYLLAGVFYIFPVTSQMRNWVSKFQLNFFVAVDIVGCYFYLAQYLFSIQNNDLLPEVIWHIIIGIIRIKRWYLRRSHQVSSILAVLITANFYIDFPTLFWLFVRWLLKFKLRVCFTGFWLMFDNKLYKFGYDINIIKLSFKAPN